VCVRGEGQDGHLGEAFKIEPQQLTDNSTLEMKSARRQGLTVFLRETWIPAAIQPLHSMRFGAAAFHIASHA
jgi:hypothetical protein